MRVVGGEARGRRFDAPPGRTTRPTSDRVREAIFTVLGSLPAGAEVPIAGATVIDLFAGSGAFGIEALSRGAAGATFVDRDRQSVATIRANLAALRLDERATVVAADALRWLGRATPVDLVLCDPPYAFVQWPELLSLLVPVAGVAVVETGAPLDLGPEWEVLREKQYGGTVVVVARPALPPAAAHDRKGDT
jgi:16S rRNA (guanine966-N2)-methyltransferase